MKELIRVRVQYASRQQCCKTHKRPLPLPLPLKELKGDEHIYQTFLSVIATRSVMSNKLHPTADPVHSRINHTSFVIHKVHVSSSHSMGSAPRPVSTTLRFGDRVQHPLSCDRKTKLLSTSGPSPPGSLYFLRADACTLFLRIKIGLRSTQIYFRLHLQVTKTAYFG